MFRNVYLAPDEFTAITIRAMLKSRNIHAEIRRFATSWFDGLPKLMNGGWGEVFVDENNLKEARQFINEFLAGSE
jgi:hypothetical protein